MFVSSYFVAVHGIIDDHEKISETSNDMPQLKEESFINHGEMHQEDSTRRRLSKTIHGGRLVVRLREDTQGKHSKLDNPKVRELVHRYNAAKLQSRDQGPSMSDYPVGE